MSKSENFTYWNRPWQKWCILIGGISQVALLYLNIQERNDISNVKDKIFSPTGWEHYVIQQDFQSSIYGISALIFLGIFLIGTFSRNKKSAKIAEGSLLLSVALIWGIFGFMFNFTLDNNIKIIWGILLLITFIGSVYTFWQKRRLQA